jgi:hypothetical protein
LLEREWVEELDAAQGNLRRGCRDTQFILQVQEVLSQFFYIDSIGGFLMVLCQSAHSAQVGFLHISRHASRLQVFNHAFSKSSHGYTPICGKNGLIRIKPQIISRGIVWGKNARKACAKRLVQGIRWRVFYLNQAISWGEFLSRYPSNHRKWCNIIIWLDKLHVLYVSICHIPVGRDLSVRSVSWWYARCKMLPVTTSGWLGRMARATS